MFLSIIIFIIFFAVLDLLWRYWQDMKGNIPGPAPLPFIGSILAYAGYTEESLLEKVKGENKLYGGMYRVWVGYRRICIVCEPEDIELILNNSKHIKKNEVYDLLRPWLKSGLLMSSGSKWFARRKIITPTFHFSILEQFVKIFDQQSNILVKKLERLVDEDHKAFDIHPYIALAALDAVSESALGIEINTQEDPECAYVKAIEAISAIVSHRFLSIILRPSILFATLGYNIKKRHDKLLNTLHSFTQKIIAERRQHLETEMDNPRIKDEDDKDIGKKKRMALLDVLLQARINNKPLSDDDIREEVDTFTFEGHDTTTSGICFALYTISRNQEIQNKVFREIREIFGDDKDKPVSYKELQQLKYTDLVIREVLRMFPPVPFIGRCIEEDINVNGKLLTAGTSAQFTLLITMKNPKYFPEPEKFIPERHSAENSAETLNPFAYIPFSAGPRNCIGQKYAMLEMKAIISKILRHYELIPNGNEIKPFINLVLRSRTGFQIGIKPRVYSV